MRWFLPNPLRMLFSMEALVSTRVRLANKGRKNSMSSKGREMTTGIGTNSNRVNKGGREKATVTNVTSRGIGPRHAELMLLNQ